jgi:hypothetical protein
VTGIATAPANRTGTTQRNRRNRRVLMGGSSGRGSWLSET